MRGSRRIWWCGSTTARWRPSRVDQARLAQESGFAGRLVVLGEPDIAPGDGRIEWADGGFVIDAQRLSQLVEQAVDGRLRPAGPRSLPSEDTMSKATISTCRH
jgi:hypothetical protein